MEAVRTLSDYSAGFVAIQRLDILRRDGRVQILIAEPPRGIAGAGFLFAEDPKLDSRLLHQRRERARHFLIALIERPGASNPVQNVEIGGIFDLRHLRDAEARGPLRALLSGESPRIALVFDSLECAGRLLRKFAFHQDFVAAHINDALDMLDADRASFLAPSAGRASPYRGFGRDLSNHVGPV